MPKHILLDVIPQTTNERIMNCYNHPDRPAVIQCRNCGKGFCREEAELFVDGLCHECSRKDIAIANEA